MFKVFEILSVLLPKSHKITKHNFRPRNDSSNFTDSKMISDGKKEKGEEWGSL